MDLTKEQLRQEWLYALRYGEYKQITGNLHSPDGYCCLGVACDVYMKNGGDLTEIVYKGGDGSIRDKDSTLYGFKETGVCEDDVDYYSLPQSVLEAYGFLDHLGKFSDSITTLSSLNDRGDTFEQIAHVVENNADKLFKE